MYINTPNGLRAQAPRPERKIVTRTAGRRERQQEQKDRRRQPDRRRQQQAITFKNRRQHADRRGQRVLLNKDLQQEAIDNPIGQNINTRI